MKNKNDDDKYKEENSQPQDGNKSVINKTKEEEALIKLLMSMNFKQYFYFVPEKMLELEKINK